ncbi:unnamed protein product [Linum trigynum]|uniref:Uncharacterized protein n=1 Tax=Linum trigynum TaxID=586398 RepID=A0AAV2GQC8_9ROSI
MGVVPALSQIQSSHVSWLKQWARQEGARLLNKRDKRHLFSTNRERTTVGASEAPWVTMSLGLIIEEEEESMKGDDETPGKWSALDEKEACDAGAFRKRLECLSCK